LKITLILNTTFNNKMRASTYPVSLKNYLKIVPSCAIFFYLLTIHPTMVYNHVFHGKERIERIFFRRTRFEKYISRRDDYLRLHFQPKMEWQPSDLTRGMRPLSRL
jgi:hypothetical protein